MTRHQITTRLREMASELRSRGVAALYLFGSTSRDEAGAGSDIDLFIDCNADARLSLFDLAGLKQHLENQLKAEVDLTTRDSLHPMLRSEIEKSAIQVF